VALYRDSSPVVQIEQQELGKKPFSGMPGRPFSTGGFFCSVDSLAGVLVVLLNLIPGFDVGFTM
jgi:hypothetical protein